jgi:KaiC/GvpD/RAD55 family RecA-like ATPase
MGDARPRQTSQGAERDGMVSNHRRNSTGGRLTQGGRQSGPLVTTWKWSSLQRDRKGLGRMPSSAEQAGTGVFGLDDVLQGGLSRGHLFLVEGEPGAGKTTLALQFLLEGAKAGENSLYITLSETDAELRSGAESHGWTLGPEISVFELIPPENLLDSKQQQSLLYSSDLELGETTQQIFDVVERTKPSRVVLDSLSEIRLLAQSSLRYRRQILAIKHYFSRHRATVIMLDDLTGEAADKTVHSVAHGVIRLEELAPTRCRTSSAAHLEVPRATVPRGLSRFHDHDRRHQRLPATCRRRTRNSIRAHTSIDRHLRV